MIVLRARHLRQNCRWRWLRLTCLFPALEARWFDQRTLAKMHPCRATGPGFLGE